MKVCVLGGGHGCHAAAIDLFEKGHDVAWWRRDRAPHARLRALGALTVTDARGTRTVPVGDARGAIRATDDLGAALRGAELVVVPLPATSHEALAADVAPLLEDGQVVFLPPGTFGSFVFARAAARAGNRARFAFAETGTLPYLVRKHGDGNVVISAYATRLPTGVFPAREANWAFDVLRAGYPSVEPLDDALSGALMNAGPVIHPPLILMNAGPLEHFDAWDIHNEGTQPSIRAVTNALDAERIAVREALGYRAPHFPLADHYAADGDEWMYGRGAHGKLTDSGDWREKIDLRAHRYMLEDTRLGLSFLVSCGRWAGVPTPVAQGLLAIAGAVAARDLYAEGRTLERLGLAALSRDAMRTLLETGDAA
ncbi:NAD/NADP octopine/nopaline dehydrogenase family protein [Burkholderia multivorans]|uniref:NAD/NADP-dependent octopine/nopaline dehydrogenase family protein n=1 Tax=Burkholderia multivorans TaxID=87883 RepID=UPI001C255296|nr:NAD/NADP-dependent octopine/nopaline dehydrogenase family protein [Burkholderia multivorans]MBU9543314.1 NAD/NADP octopine/nopaline dehydrogenase family protein [Burkholderia multivorans]MCA8175074.1 NAD/NADP octopine/nopaline dehydrogenase family protein [Burkholderia multivorans]